MKRIGCFLKIVLLGVVAYVLLLALMFVNQEKLIFHANPLPPDHQFKTEWPFEEVFLPTSDQETLHGLLFRSENSKGVVLYWHGNSGNLQGWSYIAPMYTQLGYDLFLVDYRGFGKSTGTIVSESQVFSDAQLSYEYLKQYYSEDEIVLAGYSIGTGIATWLAQENHPKCLVLQAPYVSLKEMTQYRFPFVPTFLLQFEFDTEKYIQKVSCPIYMFHGKQDKVIPFQQAQKLAEHLKPSDHFFLIEGQGHGRFNDNRMFQRYLIEFLK